nr:DNA mismatch repair endonuclease MutL [Endobacter medicaginis]
MISALRRLPDHIVDRIAAGEVIERPAAAAKELVENALDAGATRIEVCLRNGGIDWLEVVDDGCGMSPSELGLAIERHCTSKLVDESLVRIATLGFRGEALPSIGAAARLSLISRPEGASEAWKITVAGGVIAPAAPHPGVKGTRVCVEDLFFATPARRKFLRSPRVEAEHVIQGLRRLALAAPGVAFRLSVDARVVFDLPAQARDDRIAALLGEADAYGRDEPWRLIDGARDGMRLTGLAAGPATTRSTANGISLVVNGRPVADPMLRSAVRVAYRDVIAAGRHPVAALYLDIPVDRLDVNVHPAKTELRFAEPETVRALVIGTLRRALGLAVGSASALTQMRRPGGAIWAPPEPVPAASGFAEATLAYASRPAARFELGAPSARVLPAPAEVPEAVAGYPLGAPVAQVLDTYVIAVAADGSLVLVDQHAAHERLTHERLHAQYLEGGVRAQRLLMPLVVDLPPGHAAALAGQASLLARLGVEIEAFGGGAVLVRALPALLGAPDPTPLLRDLAEQLEADPLSDALEADALERRLDAALARLACHGSIRAGRRLDRAEMDALLRQMETTPRAATCSHGRPTYLKLSKAQIETLFGRR